MEKQIQIEDYIEIILRRKWFIIIPFVISILGIVLAFIFIPYQYKSITLILVERQKVPEAYVKPTITADVADRLSTITQQVMSRTRLESIINEFGLYNDLRNRLTSDELVEIMRKNVEVEVKGDTKREDLSSFTISYIGNNPEIVMHVAGRLASLFIEENLKVREQQAIGTTEFLDAQLQDLKKGLEGQEVLIKAFKERYMGELPSQLEANLRTLDRLQLELQTTNDSLRGAEERKIILEKQLADLNSSVIIATGSRTAIQADPLRTRLIALQAELSQMKSVYTEKYPDIIRLKNEIAETESELKKGQSSGKDAANAVRSPVMSDNPLYISLSNQQIGVNTEVKGLREKQKEIMKNIAAFQSRVERIPEREQQMASIMRDYENSRINYQNLLNKKLDAQLAENLEKRQKGEQFRILDPANLPLKPFKPDPRKIILIGILIGLGTGGGLAYLIEYIDGSFRKPEDIYATTGLPVLATVPRIRIGR